MAWTNSKILKQLTKHRKLKENQGLEYNTATNSPAYVQDKVPHSWYKPKYILTMARPQD